MKIGKSVTILVLCIVVYLVTIIFSKILLHEVNCYMYLILTVLCVLFFAYKALNLFLRLVMHRTVYAFVKVGEVIWMLMIGLELN